MANEPFVARFGLQVANNIFVVNGSNVGVNTATPAYSITVNTVDGVRLPAGNTGQRPTAANGVIRFNSETNTFEGVANNTWNLIGGIRVYDTANTQIYP